MAEFSSLSYELDGIPKMLVSLDEVETAIARGTIAPDTRVTVYLSDRSSSERAAVEHDALSALFARHAPAPEPEVAPVVPEAAPVPAAPAPQTAPVPQTAPAAAQTEQTTSPEPAPQPMPQPAPQEAFTPQFDVSGGNSSGVGKTVALILAGVVILFLLYKLFMADTGSEYVPQAVDDAPVVETETAASMTDDQLAEQATTYYMARWGNVRNAPNARAAEMGRVERGEEVSGIFVPSQSDANFKWLRITSGRFAGGYVSAINLIGNAPPSIDMSQAGEYYLASAATLYAGPSTASGTVAKAPSWLPAGEFVRVFGDVGGMAEIEHKEGGVAYIEWSSVFGGYSGNYPEGDALSASQADIDAAEATADAAMEGAAAAREAAEAAANGESASTADLPAYRTGN